MGEVVKYWETSSGCYLYRYSRLVQKEAWVGAHSLVLVRIAYFRLTPGGNTLKQAFRVAFQVSTVFISIYFPGLPSMAMARSTKL